MSIIILTNIHISDIIFTMITFKKLVVSSKNIHKLDVESSLLVDYANRNNIPTFVVSEKAIIRKKIDVDNTTLVAGSIPFVLSALRHLNIEIPKHNPYPIILKDYLNRNAMLSLNKAEETVDKVLAESFKNKQWFLNYLDELNKQSVRY